MLENISRKSKGDVQEGTASENTRDNHRVNMIFFIMFIIAYIFPKENTCLWEGINKKKDTY